MSWLSFIFNLETDIWLVRIFTCGGDASWLSFIFNLEANILLVRILPRGRDVS